VTAIGRLTADRLDPSGAGLVDGQFLFHSRHGDPDHAAFAQLEGSDPVTLGPFRIVPVASDPRLDWWLLRVSAAPG
jgi:hypothetical protein